MLRTLLLALAFSLPVWGSFAPPAAATTVSTCDLPSPPGCAGRATGVAAGGSEAGGGHTCVLVSSGNVDCYGRNDYSQANDYTGWDAVAVAAGGYHTCILLASGNVDCTDSGSPRDYLGGDAVAVASGVWHACALLASGNVDCSGWDSHGQASDYTGGNAVAVAAGGFHTCLLLSSRNVDCYGYNFDGQAADYLGGNAVAVAGGDRHTCVLLSSGNVDCSGLNNYGQANDYTGGDAVAVAAGGDHTCVLLSAGNVDCYGRNTHGQATDYPVGDAIAVAAGYYHTCIILSSGNVDCFGLNESGRAEDWAASRVASRSAAFGAQSSPRVPSEPVGTPPLVTPSTCAVPACTDTTPVLGRTCDSVGLLCVGPIKVDPVCQTASQACIAPQTVHSGTHLADTPEQEPIPIAPAVAAGILVDRPAARTSVTPGSYAVQPTLVPGPVPIEVCPNTCVLPFVAVDPKLYAHGEVAYGVGAESGNLVLP